MVRGHICDSPVDVLIEDPSGEAEPLRLPVVDDGVEVHERKDGPLSFGRRAEIDFPLQAFGEEWFKHINAMEPSGRIQNVLIKLRKMNVEGQFTEQERRIMRGYIGNVGAAGDNIGHLTVYGPFKMLSQIPAEVALSSGAARHTGGYIVNTLTNTQNLFQDIELNVAEDIVDSTDTPGPDPRGPTDPPDKTFTPNRDTLADVIRWFLKKSEYYAFFEPTETGVVLNIEWSPGRQFDAEGTGINSQEVPRPFEDYSTGDDIELINNDALAELNPFNSVLLIGGSKVAVGAKYSTELGGGEAYEGYAQSFAWYPPLVERSGGYITAKEPSTGSEPDNVAAEARKRLKERLDGVSGGTMTAALNPDVRPFDYIEAKPACATIISPDLPTLNYEVERTGHIVNPDNLTNAVPTSEYAVTLAIEPELIQHETTVKSMTPAEGELNRPSSAPDWAPEWEA